MLTVLMTLLLAAGPAPSERASEIVSRLTLEQKASLMMHTSSAIPQQGIPAYNWWNEALHGVARSGKATVFPQPVGMAATFDEALVEEVFTAVSDEARIKNRQAREQGNVGWYNGITFWTPNINIFRDPRWGRGMETYGEDPYLTGLLGMAVVRGLQGDPDSPVLKAHACAKHFAVHSGPEWNRHSFNAEVSERDLRETYLPAFKDLVTKAHVQEVMIAYNRFRGQPCGASDYLVNTILRGEWGYEGLVVSDCWAVSDFYKPGCHGYSPDAVSAVAAAVHNGTDLECGEAYRFIPEAVRRGLLNEADVDRSLTRLLAARIRLGELDGISLWDNLPDTLVEGAGHRALSLRAAQESIVLLQNRRRILPLRKLSRIALVGPNADDAQMQWGNYNPVPDSTLTLRQALCRRIPGLICVHGCGIVQPAADVQAVLDSLKGADVVIFAGGISPRYEGEEMYVDTPGFRGGDRTSIELPQAQRDLLTALKAAGKKVILVNFSGSAIALEPETRSCDAILQAWYPGQEGGTAIAGVLLGDVAPSGKLPVTFYRNTEQLPDFEDYSMAGRTYRFFSGKPLFLFGYGLSYTRFRYGRARIRDGKLMVPVRNTGRRDATETVQLYVRRPSDTQGPLKTLRSVRRVTIPAGKKVWVEFPLTDDLFLWWSEKDGDMAPVEGDWELLYGGSSDRLRHRRYYMSLAAEAPAPFGPVPTAQQLEWQKMEFNLFCHFGPNTFSGQEWGSGTEAEDLFAPSALDCRQWAATAAAAGARGIIVTAKHHDGFSLWPNPESAHSVAASGAPDVLDSLSAACREYGLKFGVYISPWDRNDPSYGTPEYNGKYVRTLSSVLDGRYGDVFEVWFDGACGEGPCGKRQVYDWDAFRAAVRELQPGAVMFSDLGPGCRWVGNERGEAGTTNWSRLDAGGFEPGAGAPPADTLQAGNMLGGSWIPAECDVSIRPGWFWRESETSQIKSVQQLMTIWRQSVGRNSLLLLNVPPDVRGLIPAEDSLRLMEFRQERERAFGFDLAEGARVIASDCRGAGFCADNLVDGVSESYWAVPDGVLTPSFTVVLPRPQAVHDIVLSEYIALGQRVSGFAADALVGGSWKELAVGTTIGYKRIIPLDEPVEASVFRVRILSSLAEPVLNGFSLY